MSIFTKQFKGQGTLIGSLLFPFVIISLISALAIGFFWVNTESQKLEEDHQQYAKNYLEGQKSKLRVEVERIHQQLLQEWKRSHETLRLELKSQIEQAHQTASSIYNKYKTTHSAEQIQIMIRTALRDIRFQEGRVYYYATGLDGVEQLNPPNPHYEGQHASKLFSQAGQDVVNKTIELVLAKKEGFLEHVWERPGFAGDDHKKVSYIKLFEPYNWYIGAGDYYDGVEDSFKHHNFKEIAKIRILQNNIDNLPSNGVIDGYFSITSFSGDLFVEEGKYFAGKKNVWDDTDAKGLKYAQLSARLAKENPQGAYFTSFWETPEGGTTEKISYVLAMEEWGVFITLCFNTDTINSAIELQAQRMEQQFNDLISTITMVLTSAVIAMLIAIFLITRKHNRNIRFFQSSFAKAADQRIKIEPEAVYFQEFKKLAKSANSMIDKLNNQADELRYRSLHDDLTALPNRRHSSLYLDQMLEHCKNQNGMLALLFIDLDRFKEVNDTLGHSAGDKLLKKVSSRLKRLTRGSDIVARLGGDEFTVITGLLESKDDVVHLVERLIEGFEKPFIIEGSQRRISASIGISMYPDDGETSELLLRNADSAMYEAKRNGPSIYCFYDSNMTEVVSKRFKIVEELHRAIQLEQFVLHFQPQIDLANSDIIGAEALIRWQHPERGLLGPYEFIPYAESSGQIEQIGEWVLKHACKTLVKWQKQGYEIGKIAVNISNNQLHNNSLVDLVSGALAESNCDPSRIELEITETTLMRHPDRVVEELKQVRDIGVSIAIDDFGTGYSSLSALKMLPINKLKIDQSFIRDLNIDENDREITRAIIGMGASLNLKVIAEGVEDPEQLAFIRKAACSQAQGYLFSKPLPEQEFLTFVENHQAQQAQSAL